MRKTKRITQKSSRNKDRMFIQANAAWDHGDLREAFELFMKAAKLGDVSSQLDLGYFFDQGLSVRKDKKKALKWYRKAYWQGDAGAANNIATIYRDLGDTKKMLWWLRRAAAMGDVDVQLDLGKRYERGLAVPKDPVKAKLFYRRVLANKSATENDRVKATARLAVLIF
jgi:TPR repeat protein